MRTCTSNNVTNKNAVIESWQVRWLNNIDDNHRHYRNKNLTSAKKRIDNGNLAPQSAKFQDFIIHEKIFAVTPTMNIYGYARGIVSSVIIFILNPMLRVRQHDPLASTCLGLQALLLFLLYSEN